MTAEIIATFVSMTITIIAVFITIYFTNRSTQKILKSNQESTEKILKDHYDSTEKILERIAHAIHDIAHVTGKIAVGMDANALMHDLEVAENVEDIEEIKKIAEKYTYDSKLKICYYKPRKRIAI